MASYELKDLGDGRIEITTTFSTPEGDKTSTEVVNKEDRLAQLSADTASLQAMISENTTLTNLINAME